MNRLKSLLMFSIKEILAILLLIPGLFFLKFKYRKRKVLIVLNYHNFSRYSNYKLSRGDILKTGYRFNFERQIGFLKWFFDFANADEFFNDQCENQINVLITFDDGYRDNYDLAFPILKKYKAKCTFFVVTDLIGTPNWLWHDKVRYLIAIGKIQNIEGEQILKGMNRGVEVQQNFKNKIDFLFEDQNLPPMMMNWKNLKELDKNGFKVGAHTGTHRILAFLNNSEQKKEIEASINMLNKELNIVSNQFAYPNGSFNDFTINNLKSHNIDYAYITIPPGINSQTQDMHKIKRIGVNVSDSVFIMTFKIFLSSINILDDIRLKLS